MKLNFHTADNATIEMRAQVPNQDVILVLSDAVVYLHEQNLDVGIAAALNVGINRVAKKMRTYFEMGTDGHRFLCF